MLEIMSPENPESLNLSQSERDKIRERYIKQGSRDWRYVLDPIVDDTARGRFILLLDCLNDE